MSTRGLHHIRGRIRQHRALAKHMRSGAFVGCRRVPIIWISDGCHGCGAHQPRAIRSTIDGNEVAARTRSLAGQCHNQRPIASLCVAAYTVPSPAMIRHRARSRMPLRSSLSAIGCSISRSGVDDYRSMIAGTRSEHKQYCGLHRIAETGVVVALLIITRNIIKAAVWAVESSIVTRAEADRGLRIWRRHHRSIDQTQSGDSASASPICCAIGAKIDSAVIHQPYSPLPTSIGGQLKAGRNRDRMWIDMYCAVQSLPAAWVAGESDLSARAIRCEDVNVAAGCRVSANVVRSALRRSRKPGRQVAVLPPNRHRPAIVPRVDNTYRAVHTCGI